MEASLHIARFLDKNFFIPLLSCVRIDSFFFHAIAFGLLAFAQMSQTCLCSSDEFLQVVARGKYLGPMMDQVVYTNTELTDDAPFEPEFSKQLMQGRKFSRGGISVTYLQDYTCLKGIAYTAEAA